MSNGQIEFDEWWADFCRATRELDYDEGLSRLLDYASGLTDLKRAAFVEGLVETSWLRHGSAVALRALRQLANPDARRRIAQAVQILPSVRPPHALGDYRHMLLCVLATDPSGDYLEAVDSYCIDEIGPGFTTVVWALWPHHPARFARYHARYFAEVPWSAWGHTAVIYGFLGHPKALEVVRDALLERHPEEWSRVRDATISACSPKPQWLSEQNAREILSVCGAAAPMG